MSVYRFEEIGDDLSLVPLAGRRALDAAGRKVGLEAWRSLSIEARAAIVEAGAAAVVDGAHVRALLGGVEGTPLVAEAEPDAMEPPAAVAALGVSAARWASLTPLDRWALASLARRERLGGARALLAER